MPLTAYTGVLGLKKAVHLLRRATFGPTKQNIDDFALLTPAQALALLFSPVSEPSAPVQPGATTTWINTAPAANEDDGTNQTYFELWWMGQMLGASISASDKLAFATRERIVFFLHTFFTTIQETVNSSRALYFQNVLFRKYAFDDNTDPKITFKELTKKICVDNAMLILLDGTLNVKGKPNENFARELFELYSIGKGLPGNVPTSTTPGDYIYFTETDVQAAAKVLSGYDFDNTFSELDADTGLPKGKVKSSDSIPNQHDNTSKTFSSRFGSTVITPDNTLMSGTDPTEASMLDELSRMIEMIYGQDETALNICRRIYRFYVYHDITKDLDDDIIAAMAVTLKANSFKIEPVIKELLSSQHFYDNGNTTVDDDNYGGLIKSPLDLVAHTLAFFEFSLPDYISDTTKFYAKMGTLLSSVIAQGMNFLNPYDVAGYEAYYQYPLYNRYWISANSLTQRYEFIYASTNFDAMTTMDAKINIDLLQFVTNRFATNANDSAQLMKDIATYILPMYTETTEITTKRLNYFQSQFLKLSAALPDEDPEVFWQFSWSHKDTVDSSKADARGMLQDLINAMLQSPEYQLF